MRTTSGTVERVRSRSQARRGDPGFSLIELLVAIVVASIVGAVIVAAIVQANRSTTNTSSSVMTQSQLVDAMTRIGRDITDSTDVVSATNTSIEVRGIQGSHCVDTTYTAAGKTLTSKVEQMASATCSSVVESVSSAHSSAEVVNLAATKVFTYFNSANKLVPAPGATIATQSIRRIAYTVSAKVAGRTNPLTLSSSATPDTTQAVIGGTAPTLCPAPVLSGVLNAQTATLTWSEPASATGYLVSRDGGVVNTIHGGAATIFNDPGLAFGSTHLYTVTTVCSFGNSSPSNSVLLVLPPLAPPLKGVLVTSDNVGSLNDASLSWKGVVGATSYDLYFRNQATATTYTHLAENLSLTETRLNLVVGDTYEFYVTATNSSTSANDSPVSGQSNHVLLTPTAPAITTPPVLTVKVTYTPTPTTKPTANNSCVLSWTQANSASQGVVGYHLYVAQRNSKGWGSYGVYGTYPVSTTSVTVKNGDNTFCADGNEYEWYLVPYNTTTPNGPSSNTVVANLAPGPVTIGNYEWNESYDTSEKASEFVDYSADGAATYIAKVGSTTLTGSYLNGEAANSKYTLTVVATSPYGVSAPSGASSWTSSPREPSQVGFQSQCESKSARDVIYVDWAGTTADRFTVYYSDTETSGSYTFIRGSATVSWIAPTHAFNENMYYSFQASNSSKAGNYFSQGSASVGIHYYYNGTSNTACQTTKSWSNDSVGLNPGVDYSYQGMQIVGAHTGAFKWTWN